MKRQIIDIDGRTNSGLDWKAARKQAQETQGSILWNINLGLFQDLLHPIADQAQFLSLALSLEHFRDTLWKEFAEQTKGLCIYQGPADFRRGFWDERYRDDLFYCRDACVEYIQLLANRLPDGLDVYVMLDASSIAEPLEEAQLLTRERYERLNIIVEGGRLPIETHSEIPLGVCFPPIDMHDPIHYTGLNEALHHLLEKQIPFRIIPESFLIAEWKGLDALIVTPSGLSPQGKRKLQGFCAAGGTVLNIGESLGLANEKKWER